MSVPCDPVPVRKWPLFDARAGAVSQAHGKVTLVREAARTLAKAPVKNADKIRYPREGSPGPWVWRMSSRPKRPL